ncbi:unnamed protein product [Symbiodinium microadriaticum]|nr:unnamed protein product [Symbiodinium microadriaticum]
MRSFGPNLPADIVQNPHFLDTRTVAGLSLHRWVRRTEWTTKKQIDQCPTHFIPLHAVLYQGWNSYWIRHIAEGRPTFFAGFRSMTETVFCHALFSKLREESVDLDELGIMLSGARGSHGGMVTNDVKLQASQELASKVVEFMLGLYPQETPDPKLVEYGTASHVASVVNFPDDSTKSFMTRQWKTCRNEREVTSWIESVTLSKSNEKKLVTWSAHVQKWHDDLPASEQAALDQTVANWGVPIRDVAKLKAGSLLRILAVATVLIA